jgi:hypothetical protein
MTQTRHGPKNAKNTENRESESGELWVNESQSGRLHYRRPPGQLIADPLGVSAPCRDDGFEPIVAGMRRAARQSPIRGTPAPKFSR